MEWIILLVVGFVVYGYFDDNFKNDTNSQSNSTQTKSAKQMLEELNFDDADFHQINKKSATKPEILHEDTKNTTTINNYYTYNNIHVQQNNYYEKSKSEDENKDHSEKVWNRLGYQVKPGETYSYKFYGNKIYTPDQVEKIGSHYQIKYSETGLTKKLLNDTGSKSHAKNILVQNYGLSESKATKLLNNL